MTSDQEIYQTLTKHFGFERFRAGQLEILHKLLEQQDTLAILPTGAGKTLIYQMYGFLNQGTVLVVSPLLSLIKDQVNRLRMAGERRVTELNSQVKFMDQKRIIQNLERYKFIFISPETLQREDVQEKMKQISISLMVIDEAHCIVQWGKSFRPDYLRLGQIRQNLHNPLTLALTATASQSTRSEIIRSLGINSGDCFEYLSSIDRPNIYLDFINVENVNDKDEMLLDLLDVLPGSGIIYFSSRKVANQVSALIQQQTSLRVAPYHAGMDNYERFQVQTQFQRNELDVICATSAFGMGIDKADIRFVIHYHMPGDVESYVQEIGRAGRDGKTSVAIMLYKNGDEVIPDILNNGSIPNPDDQTDLNDEQQDLLNYYQEYGLSEVEIKNLFKKQKQQNQAQISYMLKLINIDTCHRQVLLSYFDEGYHKHGTQCCGRLTDFSLIGLNDRSNVKPTESIKLKNWRDKINLIFA